MISSAISPGKKEPKMLPEINDKVKKNLKTWYLLADNQEDRNSWINMLRYKILLFQVMKV